jgi:hypothetical protein
MAQAINFIEGFSNAYYFSSAEKEKCQLRKENQQYVIQEVAQYYYLGQIVDKIPKSACQTFPTHSFKVFYSTNWKSFLLKVIFSLFTAHVIQQLPENLPRILNFYGDYGSHLMMIATLVSSVYFLHVGAYIYGGSILGGLVFQELHQCGYVPQKLESFTRKHLFPISFIPYVLKGPSFLERVGAALVVIRFLPYMDVYISNQLGSVMDGWIKVFDNRKEALEHVIEDHKKHNQDPKDYEKTLGLVNREILCAEALKKLMIETDSSRLSEDFANFFSDVLKAFKDQTKVSS